MCIQRVVLKYLISILLPVDSSDLGRIIFHPMNTAFLSMLKDNMNSNLRDQCTILINYGFIILRSSTESVSVEICRPGIKHALIKAIKALIIINVAQIVEKRTSVSQNAVQVTRSLTTIRIDANIPKPFGPLQFIKRRTCKSVGKKEQTLVFTIIKQCFRGIVLSNYSC